MRLFFYQSFFTFQKPGFYDVWKFLLDFQHIVLYLFSSCRMIRPEIRHRKARCNALFAVFFAVKNILSHRRESEPFRGMELK